MSETRVLPMFPLGIVHFPGVVLPLQVFEPRYRALAAECLRGDHEFGVVLIERGSEVGGGDVRTDAGTVARIVAAGTDARGVLMLQTAGVRRLRVRRWLPDDPYPVAEVDEREEPALDKPGLELLGEAERAVRRALALQGELHDGAVAYDIALADEPLQAMFQLAALVPVGPLDRQRLVAEDDPAPLLTLLREMADDASSLFAHQLGAN